MESTLRENLEVIETLPTAVGDFATAAFKAREINAAGDSLARVVLLRLIPKVADTSTVREASSAYASLPINPNILTHFGLAELRGNQDAPDGLYAVTEFARGISLRERIRRVAPFSLAVSLDIAISTTQALIRAESVGVTHGNLLPETILLTPEGTVKVADYALGAAIKAAAGEPISKDNPVASIGKLLYEMLTATAPQRDLAAPLSPRSINTGIPPAVDGIVRKSTTDSRSKSYVSLASLLADLQTVREDLRTGKPMNWSPMTDQPAVPNATAIPTASKPQDDVEPDLRPLGPMTRAAEKIVREDQRETMAAKPTEPRPRTARERATDQDDYEDYAPAVRTTGQRIWRGIFITLGVAVILGIIFACAYIAVMLGGVPSDITVPNLIGKQQTDAQKLADSDHFTLVEEGHDYSDTWPLGAIYQQDPTAGRSIKAGKDVNVYVSDGPRLTDVPDLSQMTLVKAQGVLRDSGLPAGSITYDYRDVDPKGIVTSQIPAAGSKVSRDTAINLVVSKGPNPPAPPTNLSATATVPGEIDLSWDDVSSAATYNVYRDGNKIASALPQTTYSDVNIGQDGTHVYTITAVNNNGESAPSQMVRASASPGAAVAPDNSSPDSAIDSSSGALPPEQPSISSAPGAPKQRQFDIRFEVPRTGGRHNVQIEVQDTTGTNIVYDEDQYRGDTVDDTITAFGNKVIFRIFIDGKLVRQTTK